MLIPEPSNSTVNGKSRLSALAAFFQQNSQDAREVKRWSPDSECSGEFANFQLYSDRTGAMFLLIREIKDLQLHLLPSFDTKLCVNTG